MKTLAFEGTAKVSSVALVEDGRLLGESFFDGGLTQSELLLPMAEHILSSLSLTFRDIDLFAATVGPGSFTGVRIGAALVKGLAFGKDKPCAAVDTLEALAQNLVGLDGVAVPVMDARRGQVYTAIFRLTDAGVERLSDDLAISVEELAELLRPYEKEGASLRLVGDGYAVSAPALVAAGIQLSPTPVSLRNESAVSCALVAERMAKDGKTVTDTALTPTYLRLPQAERERLERQKQN